jgi:hypothetical protein
MKESEMTKKLDILYVTYETVGNLRIAEIIRRSREGGVVWVCTHDQFRTILWNGLNVDDLTGDYRARIDAMNLARTFIGVTDKNEIWFYAGTDVTWLLTIIEERKWIMITDANLGTFDDTEITMATYLTYPVAYYTDDQEDTANYLFQILTEGMIVHEGVEYWFVTGKDFVGIISERHGYIYCGATYEADLPLKMAVSFAMIRGKQNLIRFEGIDGRIYDSVVNPDLRFNWIAIETATLPIPGN